MLYEVITILPPFVNAHTHLELSDFATWAEAMGEPEPPVEFVDWILWLVRVKRTVITSYSIHYTKLYEAVDLAGVQ